MLFWTWWHSYMFLHICTSLGQNKKVQNYLDNTNKIVLWWELGQHKDNNWGIDTGLQW
jgi:hypothetical protein